MDSVYDKLQTYNSPEEQAEQDKPKSKLDEAVGEFESKAEVFMERATNAESWKGMWSTFREKGSMAMSSIQKEVNELISNEPAGQAAEPAADEEEKVQKPKEETRDLSESTETVTGQPNNMLKVLSGKAQTYLDTLDKDLASIEDRAAGYLEEAGSTIKDLLKTAVHVDGPGRDSFDEDAGHDMPSEVLYNVPEDIQNDLFSTRRGAQLHALHTSTEPFTDADSDNDKGYQEFAKSFDVEAASERIALDLEQHSKLKELMNKLVPERVAYSDFWAKYYYMREQIDKQDQKRKKILTSQQEEEDMQWDSDGEDDQVKQEDGDKEEKDEKDEKKSPRASSDSSYVQVKKKEKKAGEEEEEEEDDDWE